MSILAVQVPDVSVLCTEEMPEDEQIVSMKWQIFLWILKLNDVPELVVKMKSIPPSMFCVVATVLFLLHVSFT